MDDPGERLATAQAQDTQEDGEVMTQQEAQLASRLWSGGTSPSHSDRRALSLEAGGMILVSLSARSPEAKLSQETSLDSEPFNYSDSCEDLRDSEISERRSRRFWPLQRLNSGPSRTRQVFQSKALQSHPD